MRFSTQHLQKKNFYSGNVVKGGGGRSLNGREVRHSDDPGSNPETIKITLTTYSNLCYASGSTLIRRPPRFSVRERLKVLSLFKK